MRIFLLFFALFFLLTPQVSFAETENVGIIKGIWFSDSKFFDGDTIRIYTAIQNNSGGDVEGSIEFFDNGTSLGIKPFSALDNRIVESWIDTTAKIGEHEFSVKITELQKHDIGSSLTPIVSDSILSEKLVVIKLDTDGDGIPNDIDKDDDGDGYSDKDEIKNNTNPLDKNDKPASEKPLETKKSTEKEDSDVGEKRLFDQAPELVQKIAEQNDIIKFLTTQVDNFQNSGQSLIENEKNKIKDRTKIEKIEIDTNSSDVVIDSSETVTKKRTLFYILDFVYKQILNISAWLFSLWWFVVGLLFFGIYLLLKIIFRIFRRSRY